ncbi:hypothetical protein SFC07_03860 [Corynebacterium callunae]|uniref:hypothetical protein n=1 Tax=Corynebacterium callunae TaxID=1721 RepID=UPI003982CD17
MIYRISGILFILSTIIVLFTQAIAVAMWDGFYLLDTYLTSDLGLSTCGAFVDSFGKRLVCSPGHMWFDGGLILSGFLILCGGLFLWAVRKTSMHLGGVLLAFVGASTKVYGLNNSIPMLFIHVFSLWGTMLWAWWPRWAPSKSIIPLVNGAPTLLLLLVSIGGFIALGVLGSNGLTPGIFERLAMYPLYLWFVLLGVGVFSIPSYREKMSSMSLQQHVRQDQDADI